MNLFRVIRKWKLKADPQFQQFQGTHSTKAPEARNRYYIPSEGEHREVEQHISNSLHHHAANLKNTPSHVKFLRRASLLARETLKHPLDSDEHLHGLKVIKAHLDKGPKHDPDSHSHTHNWHDASLAHSAKLTAADALSSHELHHQLHHGYLAYHLPDMLNRAKSHMKMSNLLHQGKHAEAKTLYHAMKPATRNALGPMIHNHMNRSGGMH